ncbi:hypothetical protein PENCOP_c004G00345 [Penicillium coprophilum]|uniref:Uncharacterized protein n=1 Tax=Penicillium coprophilum TaxID=36646 RepID=A0A1V6UU18_9EURO|nr:hypothetical protein PENCOP_c004G00345 [Penicillium coprophilum]
MTMGSSFLLILPWLFESVHAFTTFNTNCTLPPSSATVSYVSSPNTRGTMSIVWSCLFTIIACTWNIQHLDLPQQLEEYPNTRSGWWRWSIKKWAISSSWFFVTIFAPEILLAKYVADLQEANQFLREIQEFSQKDGVKWTRTHCMFAVMGGFVMKKDGSQSKRPSQKANKSANSEEAGAVAEAAIEEEKNLTGHSAGDVASPERPETTLPSPPSKDDNQVPPNEKDLEPGNRSHELNILYPTDILALRKRDILEKLPDISAAYINDKSKSDNLMRLIAILQITWLCIQVIARAVGGLAVSQLEVSTVAFAFCAIIMYGLCWDKPKKVELPINIFTPEDGGAKAMEIINSKECYEGHKRTLLERLQAATRKRVESTSLRKMGLDLYDAMTLSGVLFGGVHVIAWNFAFPTHVELILWRVATLHCTCFPAFLALQYRVIVLISLYGNKKDPKKNASHPDPTKPPSPASQVSDSGQSDIERLNNGQISASPPSESARIEEHLGNEETSNKEKTEMSTVATIVLKLLGGLISLIELMTELCFFAYIIARLFMLVEMFRTLAFQPTDAYVGTWAANFPNFS